MLREAWLGKGKLRDAEGFWVIGGEFFSFGSRLNDFVLGLGSNDV